MNLKHAKLLANTPVEDLGRLGPAARNAPRQKGISASTQQMMDEIDAMSAEELANPQVQTHREKLEAIYNANNPDYIEDADILWQQMGGKPGGNPIIPPSMSSKSIKQLDEDALIDYQNIGGSRARELEIAQSERVQNNMMMQSKKQDDFNIDKAAARMKSTGQEGSEQFAKEMKAMNQKDRTRYTDEARSDGFYDQERDFLEYAKMDREAAAGMAAMTPPAAVGASTRTMGGPPNRLDQKLAKNKRIA